MSNKRQGNEEEYTSRLIFSFDFFDNQGVCTSFKGEATGSATELDRLFIKTLSELQQRIGCAEYPRIQLERFMRSKDTKPVGTSDAFSAF